MTNSIKIKEIDRTTLFYNQFDTRVRIKVPGIGFTRYYSNSFTLWERVKKEKEYYDDSYQGTMRIRQALYPMDPTPLSKLTYADCEYLMAISNSFEAIKSELSTRVKLVNQSNSMFAYFNLADTEVLDKIIETAKRNTSAISLAEHITDVHPEIMYTSAIPKRKYRLYARETRLTDGAKFKADLCEFLKKHENILFPSPGLDFWLNEQPSSITFGHWLRNTIKQSFYIEFDAPSTQILIALTYPELSGKKYELVHRT